MESNDQKLEVLRNAAANRDADALDDALGVAEWAAPDERFIEIYNGLIVQSWHHDHENLARILQKSRASSSVPFLLRAAETKFEYLAYNDCRALVKKCGWALCEIGTSDAIAALRQMAISDNPVVAEESQYRLSQMGLTQQ